MKGAAHLTVCIVLSMTLCGGAQTAPAITANGDVVTVTAAEFHVDNGTSINILQVLDALTSELSSARSAAVETSVLLNSTRSQLQATSMLLNSTRSQLTLTSSLLNDTNATLNGKIDELSSMKSTLMQTNDRLNNTNTSLFNLTQRNEDVFTLASGNGDHIDMLYRNVSKIEQLLSYFNESLSDVNARTKTARSCLEHYNNGSRIDGTYTIAESNSDPSYEVYCDMKNGGWTLAGIIHTCNAKVQVSEDRNFWNGGFGSGSHALKTNTNQNCMTPMAVGASVFLPQIQRAIDAGSTPLTKMVFHAELDLNQQATWYKEATVPSFKNYFLASSSSSTGCTDVDMTRQCRTTAIVKTGCCTSFMGMFVYDSNGQITNNPPHMRMNGDELDAKHPGVCSSTLKNPRWKDSAIDGHWGNGARIWIRA